MVNRNRNYMWEFFSFYLLLTLVFKLREGWEQGICDMLMSLICLFYNSLHKVGVNVQIYSSGEGGNLKLICT